MRGVGVVPDSASREPCSFRNPRTLIRPSATFSRGEKDPSPYPPGFEGSGTPIWSSRLARNRSIVSAVRR